MPTAESGSNAASRRLPRTRRTLRRLSLTHSLSARDAEREFQASCTSALKHPRKSVTVLSVFDRAACGSRAAPLGVFRRSLLEQIGQFYIHTNRMPSRPIEQLSSRARFLFQAASYVAFATALGCRPTLES